VAAELNELDHNELDQRHCGRVLMSQLLADHEGCCSHARTACPNEGCSVQYQRGSMNLHLEKCEQERTTCPCPGCDAHLLRKDMDAHVEATHLQSAARQLQSLWGEVARLKAASESEQRRAAASPTSCVFNWRADGWGPGEFSSETRDFGGGRGVTGKCVLVTGSGDSEHSHFIGFQIAPGLDKCRVHITLSVLDAHDKTLRQIFEDGRATAPWSRVLSDGFSWGSKFTPTAEEVARSVRADGSIRLCAVVCLFLV